ncbi:MAG: U32 family peptidase C-terminal domain-containing protein [Bdellovibrio sp.]|nr:U32 family peptidase C-terminal domain-containing protein [Bdellovibrio sp.]
MNRHINRPELLAPAGSLEKLHVAVQYGADAVYLSGQAFGLRQASDNFTLEELKQGLSFCHQNNVKAYITLNSHFHGDDFQQLDSFLKLLVKDGADALIVSDLGVLKFVHPYGIPIHLSTQASCLNSEAARFWKKMGVKRLIMGREVTLLEAKTIKEQVGLEVELFIHGSMCMSYSGNCVISNFTSGRDSNRGGCAHSCRFEYSLDLRDGGRETKTFFMSSKDLNGLELLPLCLEYEIDSLKIEGRMRGPLYVATMCKVYREALDYGPAPPMLCQNWKARLEKTSHREYAQGSLLCRAGEESIYDQRESEENPYPFAGTILEVVPDQHILLHAKTALSPGDTIEILTFQGNDISITLDQLFSIDNHPITRCRPSSVIKLPYRSGVTAKMIVRKVLPVSEQA